MDFLEIQDLINNSEFQKRVSSAISKTANSVSGEDPTSYGGQGSTWSTKRHNLASSVLLDNAGFAKIFKINCAVQPGLNGVITIENDGSLTYTGTGSIDSDIEFTVNSLWDDIAKVSYDDKNPIT